MSRSSPSLWIAIALGSSLGLAATSAARADPTKQECVAANETAQDLRRTGKLREALANLATCTALSCPAAVREDCAHRLKEVEAVMPSVVLAARDAAGDDLIAVRVTMDGQVFLDHLGGTGVPVDPGEHEFVFTADGLRPATKTVVVREGDVDRLIAVVLESTAPAPSPPAPAPAPPKPPPAHASSNGGVLSTLGVVLGVAGAAGLAAGGILGVVSKVTYDRASSECPTRQGCSREALDDRAAAGDQAAASTVAFIGGGALLGVGVALLLAAPRASAPTVGVAISVVPAIGGLSLGARW